MFHNPIPSFEVLKYFVHIDPCAHTTFQNTCLSCDVCSSLQLEDHYTNTQLYPWQKVLGGTAVTPSFLIFLAPLGVWWPFFNHHQLLLAVVFWLFYHQWSSFCSHHCSAELFGLFQWTNIIMFSVHLAWGDLVILSSIFGWLKGHGP